MKLFKTTIAILLLSSTALAQHYEHGPIHIMSPWSQALPAISKNGAAYVTLNNHGEAADRLVGASSPVAARVEIHGHTMEDGLMKMRPVESIVLTPGEYVALKPGGNHIMLMGLKQPLKEGDQFPLTLEFENAEPVEVTVTVQPLGSAPPTHGDHEHHGSDGGEKTHGHDQMQMHETEEHPHNNSMHVPAADAPSITLGLEDRPAERYTLHLATTNFQFSEQHADGGHSPGEGHAQLYIDGIDVGRIFGTTHDLGTLAPGTHEVAVGLFTNNHLAYVVDGQPVAARMTVRVLEAADRPSPAGVPKRIDLAIRDGKVDVESNTVRLKEGDLVELSWTSDERRVVHLHGYDIEMDITPGPSAVMRFDAVLSGRFPVEAHGSGHGDGPLVYVEVRPR